MEGDSRNGHLHSESYYNDETGSILNPTRYGACMLLVTWQSWQPKPPLAASYIDRDLSL